MRALSIVIGICGIIFFVIFNIYQTYQTKKLSSILLNINSALEIQIGQRTELRTYYTSLREYPNSIDELTVAFLESTLFYEQDPSTNTLKNTINFEQRAYQEILERQNKLKALKSEFKENVTNEKYSVDDANRLSRQLVSALDNLHNSELLYSSNISSYQSKIIADNFKINATIISIVIAMFLTAYLLKQKIYQYHEIKTDEELKAKTEKLIYSERVMLSIMEDANREKDNALSLMRENRLLVAIVKQSKNPILRADLNGKIIDANAAARSIIGNNNSESNPTHVVDIFKDHEKDTFLHLFKNALHEDSVQIFEATNVSTHPTIRQAFEVNLLGLRDQSQAVREVAISFLDITQRLEETEQLRLIIEQIPTALIMANSAGEITLCNAQAETLFKYEAKELIGKSIDILVPDNIRNIHPELRHSFMNSPKARAMGVGRDLKGRCKDGTEIPVEIGLNPVVTNQGTFVIASIVDISERKRNEALFPLLVEASPSAMIMVNQDGKIDFVNTQAESLFGYSKEELLNQNIEMLIPQRFTHHHPNLRKQFFSDPRSRPMGEGRDLFGLRKNGSEFPLEIGLSIVETESGIKVLSAIIDLTERKQTVAELMRTNEELEKFAYVASHDLKAPLRAVDQLATWIEEDLAGKLEEDTTNHLRLMRSRIDRMEHLLADLLEFSRSGRINGTIELVNTAELIRGVFELSSVDECFYLELKGDFPEIQTHKAPLELVFRNLISNALKHHDKETGEITISINSTGPNLLFAVADDGPGIEIEHRERVFDLFQTLRPRDEVEGSGMGLAIVKKTVESFGGLITLTPNSPRGSVFSFSWPINSNSKSE